MAIFASECRSSNGVSFYLLFTTFYDFLCGAKLWNTFLSLILRERDFINMPIYNLTSSQSGKKKSKSTSSKLAQPQNFEKLQKLKSFFDISLDLEGLFGPLFYCLAV